MQIIIYPWVLSGIKFEHCLYLLNFDEITSWGVVDLPLLLIDELRIKVEICEWWFIIHKISNKLDCQARKVY